MTIGLALVVFFMLTTGAVSDERMNSNQDTLFLKLGRTIDELSEIWPRNKIQPYRRAVSRFPHLSSCLANENDVSTIRWASFVTLAEVEVCLSYVHTDIGDLIESVNWFKNQKFSVTTQSYNRGSPPQQHNSINAIWILPSPGSFIGKKSPLTGMKARFRELFATSGLSIGVELDSSRRVTDVETGYARE